MVNTRTNAELSTAVQSALQTLLPHIRAEIREEFRTSSGPSDSGGNPPPVTIHTWLERFNKQKPRSFEKATTPECLKMEYHSIRQTNTETSTEFMQRFLRLTGFLGAAADTEEEQAKNFQWGRRVVIGISRPLNRVVTGTTVIIMTVMDQTGEVVVTTTVAATTTTLSTTTGISVMGVTRETGVSSPTDLPIRVSSSPWVPLRATPTRSVLRVDADTQESVIELLVPALSVVKLAICRRIARRTPLRVHLVRLIRSQVLRVVFSPSLRIMLLRPQFDDKIYAINALPLDMCEFDIILGMDWLTEHHATIDCRSYRVIFGDIHTPEFIYHGSLLGKSMQIVSSLQARTLLSHGCEGFLATVHDTTSDVPSIH
nr:reverse transcriptase domain-containing protein [Tanacetum cinerariifolium]